MTAPRFAVLEAARMQVGLSIQDLWIAYFALGGTAQPDTMRRYLSGLAPQSLDDDVLAHAINERFVERGANHPVPYRDDPD